MTAYESLAQMIDMLNRKIDRLTTLVEKKGSPTEKGMLSKVEAARFFGVSVCTFGRWVRNGEIPEGVRPSSYSYPKWDIETLERVKKEKTNAVRKNL
jgi:hypothetical protein